MAKSKSKTKTSSNYEPLDSNSIPKKGYIIVDTYLFYVENGNIDEIWKLSGSNTNQLVQNAREQLNLSSKTKIYVDIYGLYDIDILLDTENFTTFEEHLNSMSEEEREGLRDIEEYFMDC